MNKNMKTKKNNYCSFVPDGTWGNVCKDHDSNYAALRRGRKAADKLFFAGLYTHSRLIAYVYYFGVRLFGRLFV